ncbi:VWA domain-containing protein [Calycomorphotria hydatis]|uniref:von Willebrand factor type A domain protein n=1 Tax=Calycomorphotria hydatis TaxID=2528027 RepID=A0A517T8V5_9PLAN|nr:VWA domain-containing protein [Calycomorphotria hydatis]QDT64805.1 von Willebrand factor type A domain protein [Calycomorphotria hydatis]
MSVGRAGKSISSWWEPLRTVFPAPVRAPRFVDFLPLLLFLAAYAGLIIWLEVSRTVTFARPYLFSLMAITPWIWWMSFAGAGGLARGRGLTALLIRFALAGVLVAAIAEPQSVRTRDDLAVMYVLDVSGSIERISLDQAREFFVNTIARKPQDDQAGMVVFGRNASVELPPRPVPPSETPSVNSSIDRGATDLAASLSLSAAMLSEEQPGRIVLISDGAQTEGNLGEAIDLLQARGIPVDVLPINYAYNREVWLEKLDLPKFVKRNETYNAGVILSALSEGSGTLTLLENGDPIIELPVEYKEGKNRFEIPISLREPGYYEYTAIINVPKDADRVEHNNKVVNALQLKGEGRVAIVTDPDGDNRDWEPLAQAIREAKRQVELISAYDLPDEPLALLNYDLVIFANVGADAFDAIQLAAIRDSVRDLGMGFLMVGGPSSYAPGGYHRTAIEETLPVSTDVSNRKVLPKGALAIILHTCEFAQGNTWGKRITKQAIRVLSAKDEVGVLIYSWDGGEKWLFELTPADKYEEMVPKIEAAEIGDMPDFDSTMRMGLEGLKKSDAATKHMIIISDGDPSIPAPDLLSDFVDNKVSVSTVAVFPHNGMVGTGTLQRVAGLTGGRFYFPQDPSLLPGIFIKEAKTLKRSMIQNETVSPVIEDGLHPVLKGVSGTPDVHGYVLTTPKGFPARVLLKAPNAEATAVGEVDPLLSVWQFGIGRAGAYMSDLSTNWGRDWLTWDRFQPFVEQLVTHLSRTRTESHLRMSAEPEGQYGLILIEDYHPDGVPLKLDAVISGPNQKTEQIELRQVGPRRYEGRVPLWGEGRYQVMAIGKNGDRTDRIAGGLIVPYSPEFKRFRADPVTLQNIAKETGGKVLNLESSADEIFPKERPSRQSRSPIFDWLLIAFAILLPLDVAVRRVQLDFSTIRSLIFGDRKGSRMETMGRLLEKKRDRGETSRPVAPVEQKPLLTRPVKPKPSAPSSRPKPQSTKPPASKSGDEKSGSPGSTMSRLLDAKRRKQQRQDDSENEQE